MAQGVLVDQPEEGPKFSPWDPHNGRRKLTLAHCPLTNTHIHAHTNDNLNV